MPDATVPGVNVSRDVKIGIHFRRNLGHSRNTTLGDPSPHYLCQTLPTSMGWRRWNTQRGKRATRSARRVKSAKQLFRQQQELIQHLTIERYLSFHPQDTHHHITRYQ